MCVCVCVCVCVVFIAVEKVIHGCKTSVCVCVCVCVVYVYVLLNAVARKSKSINPCTVGSKHCLLCAIQGQ